VTPRQRDVAALIITSPWWVVVAVCVTGAVYANNIKDRLAVVEEGRSPPTIKMQQGIDSLRIESRHTYEAVTEIRALMGRSLRIPRSTDPFHPAGTP
jgi:hypothetical protein